MKRLLFSASLLALSASVGTAADWGAPNVFYSVVGTPKAAPVAPASPSAKWGPGNVFYSVVGAYKVDKTPAHSSDYVSPRDARKFFDNHASHGGGDSSGQ